MLCLVFPHSSDFNDLVAPNVYHPRFHKDLCTLLFGIFWLILKLCLQRWRYALQNSILLWIFKYSQELLYRLLLAN